MDTGYYARLAQNAKERHLTAAYGFWKGAQLTAQKANKIFVIISAVCLWAGFIFGFVVGVGVSK